MVMVATTLGRNGLQDWLIQRVTAIVLAGYCGFVGYWGNQHGFANYEAWQKLFSYQCTKYVTLLAFLMLVFHAWVGMWTVFTDYIKPTILRLPLQVVMVLAFLVEISWCVHILWG